MSMIDNQKEPSSLKEILCELASFFEKHKVRITPANEGHGGLIFERQTLEGKEETIWVEGRDYSSDVCPFKQFVDNLRKAEE